MFSELAMSLGTETASDGIGSLFWNYPLYWNPVPPLSPPENHEVNREAQALLLLNHPSSLRVLCDPVLKPP